MTSLVTLRTLRESGAMTVTQLAHATGLSRPTVTSQLDELTAQGWVEEHSPAGGMGRPARRFQFRARAGFVVGLDIGAHTIRATLSDLIGETVATERRAVPEEAGAAERLAVARQVLTAVLTEVPRSQLFAAAVGTPGVIDGTGRVAISVLPEWSGVDLASRLGRSMPFPLLVENDANLAALAEHWRGAAREADNIVHVLAGRRNGAGLIINGRLHRGRAGIAGEIGALNLIGWDEAPAELIKAAPGIAPDHAAEHVFAAAKAGEATAQAAVERFALMLAQGVAAMVLTIDPDMVVIGGGLSLASSTLLAPLTRHLDELCLSTPPVRMSELGDEAVVLGAVRLALDDVERRLFSVETLLPVEQVNLVGPSGGCG
ncbi:ROK family transcriptional regulator [Microbispora sp. NEAU-D428]|nr:ROK family transcriptional regulator [Microbispora sitophila]